MASHPANAKYPDTVAVTYDETNHKVTCVYSDRSLYLWDVRDIRKVRHCHHKSLPMVFLFWGENAHFRTFRPPLSSIPQVGKSHSFLYHAACIWGVESYPSLKEGMKGVLPTGSFITCSSDDTIRLWNLDPNMGTNTIYRRNIYSNVSHLNIFDFYDWTSMMSDSTFSAISFFCCVSSSKAFQDFTLSKI